MFWGCLIMEVSKSRLKNKNINQALFRDTELKMCRLLDESIMVDLERRAYHVLQRLRVIKFTDVHGWKQTCKVTPAHYKELLITLLFFLRLNLYTFSNGLTIDKTELTTPERSHCALYSQNWNIPNSCDRCDSVCKAVRLKTIINQILMIFGFSEYIYLLIAHEKFLNLVEVIFYGGCYLFWRRHCLYANNIFDYPACVGKCSYEVKRSGNAYISGPSNQIYPGLKYQKGPWNCNLQSPQRFICTFHHRYIVIDFNVRF